MQIALTGSSSYLAGVLLPLLENDPDIQEIIGLDLKPRTDSFKKLHWLKRDVRDPEIYKDMQGCDALVHLAFIVMPLRKESLALEINIEGSKNAFLAGAKAGVKKIVHASSCAAYGAWPDNPELISEDHPLRGMPDFYYSFSKAKVEEYLDRFEQEHPHIVVTRLRPPIFLGPTINNLMREIAARKIFVNISNRQIKAQFAWDEDIASAFHLALKKDFPGAFNVAGDGCLNAQEMADILNLWTVPLPYSLALLGTKILWHLRISKNLSPGWLKVLTYPIIINTDKARKIMGWVPKHDTRAALVRFAKEIKKADSCKA